MEAIWQIVIHTPVWVYLLLTYLIFIGINDTKTRVTKVRRIFIMPTILSALSLHTLATSDVDTGYLTIGSWLLGIVLGSILGWWQVKRLNIQVDKKHFRIHIPGTWSSMCLLLTIFGTKYYFGYVKATKPMLAEQLDFKVIVLAVTGICTGLFIGKLIQYIYCFRNSVEVNRVE